MKQHYFILVLIWLGTFSGSAQQDPQYSQYMYNTQVVNPAYVGSRDMLSFGVLYRTQWVGFNGAPKTGVFTVSTPVGSVTDMGLGLSVLRDELGPAVETNITIDYSYTLPVSNRGELSLGLKGGFNLMDVNFNTLDLFDPDDPRFQENIENRFQPQIGAGIYYNTDTFYAGLSVPNLLTTSHFDERSINNVTIDPVAAERLHYFLIAGYVFDLGDSIRFKPATLIKMVSGSPLQVDVSANFLINERFTIGASYRWDADLSALLGFQASRNIFIGFGYDYQTTDIENFSDGSYEAFLRFDLFHKSKRALSPRFF